MTDEIKDTKEELIKSAHLEVKSGDPTKEDKKFKKV